MNVSVSFCIYSFCLYTTMLSWTVAATAKPICFPWLPTAKAKLTADRKPGMVNVGVTIPKSPIFLGLWVVIFCRLEDGFFWSILLPFSFWRLRCEIEIIHIKITQSPGKKKRGPCQVSGPARCSEGLSGNADAEGWAPVLWHVRNAPEDFEQLVIVSLYHSKLVGLYILNWWVKILVYLFGILFGRYFYMPTCTSLGTKKAMLLEFPRTQPMSNMCTILKLLNPYHFNGHFRKKLEVATIYKGLYKAYVREYPNKIWPKNMVQYSPFYDPEIFRWSFHIS